MRVAAPPYASAKLPPAARRSSRSPRLLAALCASLCAAALSTPVPARAESVALLAPGGEARLSAADKDRALAALTAALQSEELTVMARPEVERRLGRRSPLRDCARADCAVELRRTLAVDLIAGVALWPDAGGDRPTSAVVTLLDQNNATFDASSPVANDDLPAAVTAAFTQARERQRRGPGPWLRIDGGPPGAVVTIDGTDEGVLPFQDRVPPGDHQLRVTLNGYETYEERIRVPPGAGAETRLEVNLERDPTQARRTPPPRRTGPTGPTPPNGEDGNGGRAIVGPLVVGLLGLASVAVAGVGLVMGDSCDRRGASGTCLDLDEPDLPVVALYGGVGLAAIAAAVVWYALSGGDGAPDPAAPTVTATPNGLQLRATF